MRHRVLWTLAVAGIAIAGCGGAHSRAASTPASTAAAAATTSTTGPGSSTAARATHRGKPSQNPWPTYHRVLARTGDASAGPPLGKARRRWTASVDGAVYAEPLIAGGKVIVATENNSVYAFNPATGHRDWRVHLATPVPGGSLPCGDIDPSGITGTPAVDTRAGVIYVVTFQPTEHRLVALDLASGRVRWRRPIDPPGADPRTHQERAALALSHGRVYVTYGGLFGDCGQYHGWVLGAPASGPNGDLAVYRVPTGREGAIWAPSGPAVDGQGNVFVATGNGSSTSSFDFGNAVIRLTPGLKESGFFAPSNAPQLSASDLDLGSTGPLLLPQSRAFIIGKTGVGYLLHTRHLGGLGHPLASRHICGAGFGGDAYAHGTIYVPCSDGLAAVHLGRRQLSPIWRQGAASFSPIVAGPGVWAIGGQSLFQLDPRSGRVRFSAPIGDPAHFATPAASGGTIFVAASDKVYAFR
jgi:outer membrane protein assembly factor BamB